MPASPTARQAFRDAATLHDADPAALSDLLAELVLALDGRRLDETDPCARLAARIAAATDLYLDEMAERARPGAA